MLKIFNNEIDELSLGILRELSQNSRVSAVAIGKRIGLTAPAVAQRIGKLEESGYIKGYNILLDFDKLGLTIQAFISFKCDRKEHDIKAVIQKIPEVTEWYVVTGNASLILKVVTHSRANLANVIAHLEEFGETTTSLILQENKLPV